MTKTDTNAAMLGYFSFASILAWTGANKIAKASAQVRAPRKGLLRRDKRRYQLRSLPPKRSGRAWWTPNALSLFYSMAVSTQNATLRVFTKKIGPVLKSRHVELRSKLWLLRISLIAGRMQPARQFEGPLRFLQNALSNSPCHATLKEPFMRRLRLLWLTSAAIPVGCSDSERGRRCPWIGFGKKMVLALPCCFARSEPCKCRCTTIRHYCSISKLRSPSIGLFFARATPQNARVAINSISR